jgi:proline dehydrogenase
MSRPFKQYAVSDILARMLVTKLCTYKWFVTNITGMMSLSFRVLGK